MNLEERLRDALTDDHLALPPWPDATVRVRAGIRRRRRRTATVAASVVAVAAIVSTAPVLLRGGGTAPPGGQPGATPTLSAVPWLDEPVDPAAPTSTPSGARAESARPCTAADLSRTAKGEPANAAGGHVQNVVRLTNVSSSTCSLVGFVDLIATDVGTGTRATLRTGYGSTFFDGGPGKRYPATIAPGEDARIDIVTGNGCYGGLGEPHRYRDVALVVAGRQYPVPGLTLQTWCPLQVGAWYTLVDEPTAAPSPRFATLSVDVVAPASVARGATLDYVVTLVNSGPVAVPLDPCPVYQQELWRNTGTYRLNCSPGEIPAGGSVRFAMRLAVASGTPLGPTPLRWDMGATADFTVPGSTTVTVTG
ncbi:MAG TPA: DUF4232 domain-containing protein [Micromonosporaceae bacterium]